MVAPVNLPPTVRHCERHRWYGAASLSCPWCPASDEVFTVKVKIDANAKPKPRPGAAAEEALARLLSTAWSVLTFGAWMRTSRVIGFTVAPCFVSQYRWGLELDPERGFRSDFAYPTASLLVEVDGGAHAAGRRKVRTDTERRGLAAANGWRVLALTVEQVNDGTTALRLVAAALAAKK